jgi:hypothetical protein
MHASAEGPFLAFRAASVMEQMKEGLHAMMMDKLCREREQPRPDQRSHNGDKAMGYRR